MPGKIKTGPQFRMFQAAAHGTLKGAGPSPSVAKKMLSDEPRSIKSVLAKKKRKIV